MDSRKKKPVNERKPNGSKTSRRYRLQFDEIEMVEHYRRVKEEAENAGVDVSTVKSGWIKSEDASLYFQNPAFKPQLQRELEDLATVLIDEVKNHAPKYEKIKRKKSKDGHLLVVDPADVHLGKLCRAFESGEEYNQQVAVKRVHEGVEGILEKSSGWNIDQIVLVAGNDILHTDTPRRTTTSGTPQDTDGMWYDNFMTGERLYVEIIEKLMQVADVHFVFNPSNHDYTNGFFLAQIIQAHFKNCKNVTFDVDISHRKYYRYHDNLIGSTHGDGAKQSDLPLLMAQESSDWSDTKHRYIYTHHVHHKTAKDFVGVTVESLRSPSGTDSWHHRNGYQHNPKAVEGFIHHKNFGQIARLTHIF